MLIEFKVTKQDYFNKAFTVGDDPWVRTNKMYPGEETRGDETRNHRITSLPSSVMNEKKFTHTLIFPWCRMNLWDVLNAFFHTSRNLIILIWLC